MTRCPSDLELEAHLLDAGRPALAGHLEACGHCAGRLAEMVRQGEEFRREVFPVTVDAVVERSRRRRWLRRLGAVLAPVGVAAAAAVVLLVRAPPVDYVGTKGATLALAVFVQTADGPRAARDGEPVPAGAAVRFQVRPAQACRLWIVSVDASGQVSRLYPASGEGAGEVDPGRPLPGGAILDGRAGPERIFAVCSTRPVTFDVVDRAAREAAAGGAPAVRAASRLAGLPREVLQASLLLEKRP